MLYDLYIKYGSILNTMMEYSDFDEITDLIMKSEELNDKHFERTKSHLYFTSPEIAELNFDDWPIYVTLERKNKFNQKHGTNKNDLY